MIKRRVAVIVLAALLLCGSLRDLGLAEEAVERAQIAATYRVDLAVFNLGDFHLTAKLKGAAYELMAQGSIFAHHRHDLSGVGQNNKHWEIVQGRRPAFPVHGHLQGREEEGGAPYDFRGWRSGPSFNRATQEAEPAQRTCNGRSA
jgi:hypothetical protein